MFVALLFSSASIHAAPSTGYRLLREEQSPRHTFRIEHYTSDDHHHQVWLVSATRPEHRQLLFPGGHDDGVSYDPDILVSPDERWIARTQTVGSAHTLVALYQQERALTYRRIAEDFEQRAWARLAASLHIPANAAPPHHSEMEALRWSAADSLLLSLSGNNCPLYGVDKWRCLYQVTTGSFRVPARYVAPNSHALLTCHP